MKGSRWVWYVEMVLAWLGLLGVALKQGQSRDYLLSYVHCIRMNFGGLYLIISIY